MCTPVPRYSFGDVVALADCKNERVTLREVSASSVPVLRGRLRQMLMAPPNPDPNPNSNSNDYHNDDNYSHPYYSKLWGLRGLHTEPICLELLSGIRLR